MRKKYFTEEERKEATRIKNQKAYDKNKDYHKQYREDNLDKIIEYRQNYYNDTVGYGIKMVKKTPEELKQQKREYQKARRQSDPIYKLKANTRTMLSNLLANRGFTKKTKSINIIGCSFDDFKTHLESKFESWMSWENYGLYNGETNYGWDLDHMIPMASAKNESDIVRLNHYTNLQPLCSYINRVIKRDNLN